MHIECAVFSHEGKLRTSNEDNYFMNGLIRENVLENRRQEKINGVGNKFVFSICDGMGGESYGEIASLCSVKAMKIFLKKKWSKQVLEEFIENARKNLEMQLFKNTCMDSGTTVTVLVFDDGIAYAANLGDSRIYLYRDKNLLQLSKDHTQAQLLAENGLLQVKDARECREGHALTRYLGTDVDVLADDFYFWEPLKLCKGDVFLLCSDGLTDMLTDEKIQYCIEKNTDRDIYELAEVLCNCALQEGGIDNITCLTVKVEDVDEKNTFWGKVAKIFGYKVKDGYL